MTRKEKYQYRKRNRLCVQCGVALHPKDKNLCSVHAHAHKRARKKYVNTHPEYVERWSKIVKQTRKEDPKRFAAYQRTMYHRHKEQALCTNCTEPALEDSNQCAKHRDVGRKYSRNYQRKKARKKRSATPP